MTTKKQKAPGEGAFGGNGIKDRLSTASYLTLSDIQSQQDDFAPRRIPFSVKDLVKSAVPVSCRVWDGDEKVWWIHQDYLETVDRLVHRHTAIDTLTGLTWSQSWLVLHLRQTAPPEVIHAAANALLAETDDPARRHRIEVAKTIVLEW